MKKSLIFMLLCTLLVACNNEEGQTVYEVKDSSPVSFKAFIKQTTRATETSFEDGDAISVFAVAPTSSGISLAPSGNYADNVQYVYNGRNFYAGYNAVTVSNTDAPELAYFAIYPYQSAASNKFIFNVKNDQRKYADYTAGDLCTSYVEPTTADEVLLEFNHRMSCIAIKFHGDNLASKSIGVKLDNVYTSCNVDINASTFSATGATGSVILGEHSTDTYQAIIVPQVVSSEQTFITLTLDGNEIPLNLAAPVDLKSGKKTTFELEIKDDKIISLDGYINSWNMGDAEDCKVVPVNIVSLTDGVAFDFNFDKEVSYYYYGYIAKESIGSVTDEEIVEVALENFTRYTPEDDLLGYLAGLEANSEYYVITFGYDSKGNRGEIIKTLVKTKPDVTNRPRVTISNVTYTSTEWNWDTSISSETKKYYMAGVSGEYASMLGDTPNILLAWYMKNEIDNGEYTSILEPGSWWMSRNSTDNDIFIYAWAVGNDNEFAGQLDTFYSSLTESAVLTLNPEKKMPDAKVVSKEHLHKCMKNVVNIFKNQNF
ncbi:MAG: fimbrillin family protein [Bacteroidales bacterium]|nr:fimbrillin family protein [Bacteroidales bacterium]